MQNKGHADNINIELSSEQKRTLEAQHRKCRGRT
jgi:hypothetical protein